MSNKPDGKDGKKSESKKAKVYKTKSDKAQKRHDTIVASHAGGKKMKTSRGTARALRRQELQDGFVVNA